MKSRVKEVGSQPGLKGCGILVGCCDFPLRLARYGQEFPVVEVQQTFYQPSLVRTLEKWRRSVPEGVEFTLKAWQLITHEASRPTYRRLREKLTDKKRREAGAFRVNPTVMAAWRRTLDCARVLRSRLILFQCPRAFVRLLKTCRIFGPFSARSAVELRGSARMQG